MLIAALEDLGIPMRTEWYELVKVAVDPMRDWIRTAATRVCDLCGAHIDHMGGAGEGSICIVCGDGLKAGKLRGCVSVIEADETRIRPGDQFTLHGELHYLQDFGGHKAEFLSSMVWTVDSVTCSGVSLRAKGYGLLNGINTADYGNGAISVRLEEFERDARRVGR